MRQSYRLIWNSIAIWGLRVLRVIPQLFLLPFIIHRLGESLYGIYILAWSIIPVLDLLQGGIASGIVKYSAQFLRNKEIDKVNRILSNACLMTGTLGFLGGGFILFITTFIPGWLESISAENAQQLKLACNIVGLAIITSFPIMPYAGILHSLQRYDIYNLIKVLFAYIQVGVIVSWFLIFSPSFEVLVIASGISYFLSNLFLVFIAYKIVPGLSNSSKYYHTGAFKLLLGFGSVMFLCNICLVINTSGIRWMMGILVSPAFVGVLAIITKPAQLIQQIVQAMSLSVMPAASKYFADKDIKTLSELLVRGTRYIVLVLIVGMMSVLLMTKSVLKIWMGAEYQYLTVYVILLCTSTSILLSSSCAHHMLRGMGMLRASLMSAAIGPVFITVGLIGGLLKLDISPYYAVTIGLSAGYVFSAILKNFYCLRKLGNSMLSFYWLAYGQGLIVAVPVFLIFWLVSNIFWNDALMANLLISFIAILTFIIVFVLIFATTKEKEMTKRIISKVFMLLFKKRYAK